MKNILLLILIAFGMNVKGQITFEQTYDSAATYNFCSGNLSQLMMVKFEVSGERYVKINRCGKYIKLYDLSHSLVKTISIASLPTDGGTIGPILYLSEKLFNGSKRNLFSRQYWF